VFFGEDQGRYLATVTPGNHKAVVSRAKEAGVPAVQIGVTGGSDLKLGGSGPISVAKLREAHETWFPAFMAGKS
jgi:hypothetical protein